MMQYKEGKTHLVFLAFVSLNVRNIEMINIRLSGSSEFKVFCNVVCVSQKFCPNFVLKNSLFFSLSQNCLGKTPVNMVEHFIQGHSCLFLCYSEAARFSL